MMDQPTCRIAPKNSYGDTNVSIFSSLGNCQTSCQAKYSCDPTTNIWENTV